MPDLMTRRRSGLLAALAAGAFAACASVSTSIDYDRTIDFSRYRTYSWRDGHRVTNPIADRRIKEAVDIALASRGLRRVEGGADLNVYDHGRTSRDYVVESWGPTWGYGWRWGWPGHFGPTPVVVREIPIGTLVIDLVDARDRELAWRGTARRIIDRAASPEERRAGLQEAVDQLFRDYPPGARS
jgi:hypothetical protein